MPENEKCTQCGNCCRRVGTYFWVKAYQVRNQTPHKPILKKLFDNILNMMPEDFKDDWCDCEMLEEGEDGKTRCLIQATYGEGVKSTLCADFASGNEYCQLIRRDGLPFRATLPKKIPVPVPSKVVAQKFRDFPDEDFGGMNAKDS